MRQVHTSAAPENPSPFSQGMKSGGFLFCAQVPVHPDGEVKASIDERRTSERIAGEDVREQTAQTLEYIEAILEEGGTALENVVKTTVYLTDMDLYDEFNEVYREYMSQPYPARTLVEVSELAHDCYVEIEVIAET